MKKLEYVPPRSEEYAEKIAEIALCLDDALRAISVYLLWVENERQEKNSLEKAKYMN